MPEVREDELHRLSLKSQDEPGVLPLVRRKADTKADGLDRAERSRFHKSKTTVSSIPRPFPKEQHALAGNGYRRAPRPTDDPAPSEMHTPESSGAAERQADYKALALEKARCRDRVEPGVSLCG